MLPAIAVSEIIRKLHFVTATAEAAADIDDSTKRKRMRRLLKKQLQNRTNEDCLINQASVFFQLLTDSINSVRNQTVTFDNG